MSTKASLAYGEGFHLYHEQLDEEEAVYLELEGDGVHFKVDQRSVTVRIPLHVWEYIRHRGGFQPQYHEMDDAALLQHVTNEVDERIREWEASSSKSVFLEICGSAVYGLASAPRDQQIAHGVVWATTRRAEEQAILARIQALAAKDPLLSE